MLCACKWDLTDPKTVGIIKIGPGIAWEIEIEKFKMAASEKN